jgi:hypothetical protein
MMAVDRITPGYSDYAAAVNALIALDNLGAINITPSVIVGEDIRGPSGTAAPRFQKAPKKRSSTTSSQNAGVDKQQSFVF